MTELSNDIVATSVGKFLTELTEEGHMSFDHGLESKSRGHPWDHVGTSRIVNNGRSKQLSSMERLIDYSR